MAIFKRTKEVKQLINKLGNGKIKIITGLRQCGKTYLLKTLFYNKLKSLKRITDDSFVKIDLLKEHSAFKSERDFRDLLNRCYFYNPKIIFIDEVQLAENYQNAVIDFFINHPNIDLYVTGSNSNTLSVDIFKHFKEYGDQIKVYPLTYKEIKKYKKTYSLLDYLTYGGIPLVVNSKNKFEQLNNIFDQIYELDILDRLNKINQKCLSRIDCDEIFTNIVSSPTQFSVSAFVDKIAKKSNASRDKRIEIGKAIKDYLEILEQSFLITKVDNYDFNNKVPLSKIGLGNKYYCTDCGIAYMKCNIVSHKLPLSLEHSIYLHLLYKDIYPMCLLFLDEKNKLDGEIDFVYENEYVQVVYSLTNNNYEREIGNLLKVNSTSSKTIVFMNNEYDGTYENIRFIDAEQFLLSK